VVGEGGPEPADEDRQLVARLRGLRVGPQVVGELVAGDDTASGDGEAGQQAPLLARAERRRLDTLDDKPAEHAHAQLGHPAIMALGSHEDQELGGGDLAMR
jgi:hypothetical protein